MTEPEIIDKPKSMINDIADIKEQLKIITETHPTKEKKKSFKLPSAVKRQTRNLKKMMEKNKVQVLLLKNTGGISPTIGEINSGRLIIGDKIWNAADDIIWNWGGKVPTAIVCEWDMQPLTKRRLTDDTNDLKTWIHPQTIILRAIEAKEALEGKGKFTFKPAVLIVLGVIALVVYYLFFGG